MEGQKEYFSNKFMFLLFGPFLAFFQNLKFFYSLHLQNAFHLGDFSDIQEHLPSGIFPDVQEGQNLVPDVHAHPLLFSIESSMSKVALLTYFSDDMNSNLRKTLQLSGKINTFALVSLENFGDVI